MTELIVLHDLGASGGDEWAEAFGAWRGEVLAPDLPGHGDAPPPVGGHHEIGDAVYVALDLIRDRPPAERVVVGVGQNGAAAQVLALGGRASALVLVDGLGGPWLDVAARNQALRDVRRRILVTPAALEAPPPGETDPRARLVPTATNRQFAVRQAEAMPVPTLVVETPESVTPDAVEVVEHFADASLVELDERSPASIARVVLDWLATR